MRRDSYDHKRKFRLINKPSANIQRSPSILRRLLCFKTERMQQQLPERMDVDSRDEAVLSLKRCDRRANGHCFGFAERGSAAVRLVTGRAAGGPPGKAVEVAVEVDATAALDVGRRSHVFAVETVDPCVRVTVHVDKRCEVEAAAARKR